MLPSLKLGIGVATIGTIAGAGYAGSTYFLNNDQNNIDNNKDTDKEEDNPITTTSIRTKIESEFQYILLKTEGQTDDSYWQENWKNYKTENTNNDTGKDIFKLEGWVKGGSKDLVEQLKSKCLELSGANLSGENDPTYSNVTKYCSRGVTVKEDAEKKGKTILVTDPNGSHKNIWNTRNTNKDSLKDSLDKLNIKGTDLNADKIREGCATAKSQNKQAQEYQKIYDAYVKVCTKQDGDTE
ncbi:hypothetical protein A6V39_01275 [Candidatus Mycoplasma haematobovis]|uniref:Uncharacterized protein n=1 Tax=Candidatus Mycoplasma haematobovis TaxID=432608 RepID=A0A1A9QFD8_9MOLU|nr:hypothetical protein [Candidatus Mycoplasma haematobovis]OAL10685.1 hypothetical protein A6V39_01275 [Candidatus Mycoplasma haematobovis]